MSETVDVEAIKRRWSTAHDRGAHDYTDEGCRVLAEHAFTDIAVLVAALRERDERIRELENDLVAAFSIRDAALAASPDPEEPRA